MSRNRFMLVLGLLVAFGMLLSACGGQEPTEVPATEAPTEAPVIVRNGAWVDQVVFVNQESAEAAVTQLQAGEIDLYAYSVSDPGLFETVQNDPALDYTIAFGSYNELTFNPVLNFNDERLNPFGDPQIREAVNWLIDRDLISQEIFGGLSKPKYTTLNSSFPDYARYIDASRSIENLYAYDFDRANTVIAERMTALGATLNADGKWEHNGALVTVVVLIRVEDERLEIGHYLAGELEKVGFTVDAQEKTSPEASPLWLRGDPAEGLWNVYTGGWITTAISRDDGSNFGYFYTNMGLSVPLWQAYVNDPAFYEACEKLWYNDFADMDERAEIFKTALELSMKDSTRVWVNDEISFSPISADLQVTYDLAGGIAGAQLWPFTIRFAGQEGGVVTWAQPGILVDPWNPVSGSNWVYDTAGYRPTMDYGTITNPYTGLAMPQRVEKIDVLATNGLPIGLTLDWVTLTFTDEIAVPADAWADWDAVNQEFIPAGEGKTALIKVTTTYPADMFTTSKWHDGSALSVGDFIMGMIMTFDLGKPESPIYDEAYVASLEAYMSHFKGVKIVSTDPLIIETYEDQYSMDAENNAYTWWPNYGFGPGSWHAIAMGSLAETNQELAFSTDKATALGIEWMSYIAGPSLAILETYLAQAAADSYIPYAPTMGQFVTAEEASTRYANLQAWYDARHHFWVGTGPFYLETVYPVESTITLARFADYPDPADKWAGFAAPKIAVIDIVGPASATIGETATFDVSVTFDNAPYPQAEIDGVKYLVYDATGALLTVGEAEFVADGQYTITVDTTGMPAGANKVEVAVTSKVVAIPGITSVEFVTANP